MSDCCKVGQKRTRKEVEYHVHQGSDGSPLYWIDVKRFEELSRGANSIVYRGVMRETGQVVALKEIQTLDPYHAMSITEEIHALEVARGMTGLVQYHGWYCAPETGKKVLVMEYMTGGDLSTKIKNAGRLPLGRIASITRDVLQGLVSLHTDLEMLHGDIKPGNILLDQMGRAKLGDFGLTNKLEAQHPYKRHLLGTTLYMPPECFEQKNHSFGIDIWSLGITVLECATGTCPYRSADSPIGVMLQLLNEPTPQAPFYFPVEFRDFVSAALTRDAGRRPTAHQLLRHPFIIQHAQNFIDISKKLSISTCKGRLWELAHVLVARHYTLRDQLGCCRAFPEPLRRTYRPNSTAIVAGQMFRGPVAIIEELRRFVHSKQHKNSLHHEIIRLDIQLAHWYHPRELKRLPMIRVSLHVVLLRPFDPFHGPPVFTMREELYLSLSKRELPWIWHHRCTPVLSS